MTEDAKSVEAATVAMQSSPSPRPDSKTRRYDRQLRLWAASGQNALENAHVLVLSSSATSTSILKNLVLPGIGHFTILDPGQATAEDVGNNFFLDGPDSIGKYRADEAVRLLLELNESVKGYADKRSLEEVLLKDPKYFTTFDLIIAHNTNADLLDKLSTLLWTSSPQTRLLVVRSAGFLAELFIQYHEHTIIDSHPESAPSLRIDKPFPALLEHARNLNFDEMDSTEHGHIPYVVILVRVMDDWKAAHGGEPPKNSAEQKEFKEIILSMKQKFDEENFDEAVAQAYRSWTETKVPSEITELFNDESLKILSPSSPPFFHLLSALQKFVSQPPNCLPLTSTLPDMKSDTANYIHLQKLYKARAEEEKHIFMEILRNGYKEGSFGAGTQDEVPMAMIDEFVKNSHGLKILRGSQWGSYDKDREAIDAGLQQSPREAATHLALSALARQQTEQPGASPESTILREYITHQVSAEFPPELDEAVGEVVRTPTADLPNTAAFLGGVVAQEAIKMITRQYVPLKGICVIDLIASTTGVIGN